MIPVFMDDVVAYPVVTGRRIPIEDGALHVWGNKVFTTIGNILYFTKHSDLCTGMWAWQGEVFRCIKITAKSFDLEANLFAQCVKMGFEPFEIPINFTARHGSESKINIWHSFAVIWKLIEERFTK
jgi:dolichol-phosphate mannosyltransferase